MNNVNRLPDCYRKDTAGNNFKLLEINQQAAKELKEDIQALREVLNLNSAFGTSLDLYGGTLGRLRGDMGDSQYRYALYAQIGRNNVTGDYESIMSALVMMFGLEIGQVTPDDFELVEDEERCLVRLKRYPEVLEGAGFEIREIYQMIKDLLPICVPLLIQFYYCYKALIRYENNLRILAEFYPRYNLAYHHWEGSHTLGGGKYLNGYDAAALVDFYPVVQAISMDVLPDAAVVPVLCGMADVRCNVAADTESTVMAESVADTRLSNGIAVSGDVEAAPEETACITTGQEAAAGIGEGANAGFSTGMVLDVVPSIRGRVSGSVGAGPEGCGTTQAAFCVGNHVQAGGAAEMHAEVLGAAGIGAGQRLRGMVDASGIGGAGMGFRAESAVMAEAVMGCVYYRAEALVAPRAMGTGTAGAAYPVVAGYYNSLAVEKNLRYMDGSRALAGTSLLNADIFNYKL